MDDQKKDHPDLRISKKIKEPPQTTRDTWHNLPMILKILTAQITEEIYF